MTEYIKRKELLLSISSKIESCMKCGLHETRTLAVPGEGSIDTPVMFVGEGPGADEDVSGRPFVGKAGELLTKILESVNLSRQDVYITNVVKCRPPKNRVPLSEERDACMPYLLSQIAIIKPQLIVPMGATALSFFLDNQEDIKITKERGKLMDWHSGIKLFPIFHPSYLLRNQSTAPGSPKQLTWIDIKNVRKMYDQLLQGKEIFID